ncbi:hypothetical protein HYW66_00105 [Candidatus Microgenomates bacterium]|nr:hypothetical protein [Candidatus Microgenomates bacterium]
MVNINLLKRAQTPQLTKKRIKNTLNYISFLLFTILVILWAVSFMINLLLAVKVQDASQLIKRAEIEITSFAELEVMRRTINDKLNSIEKINKQDYRFDEKVIAIEDILPPDVFLQQATFTSKTFSFSITSIKLSSLNIFIESLVSREKGAKFFQKIILEGLGFDEKDGSYKMNISGELL